MLRSIVLWVTFHCNYSCPYCITRLRVKEMPEYEPPERWIEAINRIATPLTIDITGGEPSIYPGLSDLVQGIDPRHRLALTTNFSLALPLSLYQRLCSLTLSFHPSMLDEAAKTHFIHRASALKKATTIPITINYVASVPQMWEIPSYKKVFEENGIRFHVDAHAEAQYTPAEIAFLKPYLAGDRLIGEDKTRLFSKPRLCSAGMTYGQVLPDGTLIPCFAKSTLGSFFDNPLPLYGGLRYCDAPGCGGCDWDACEIRDLAGNLIKGGK